MSDPHTETPGHPQPEDWAGEMGARWLAGIDRFESMIAPVGDALLARAAVAPGARVLDLGCGGGVTSLALAAAVGSAGTVTGVDISPDLVARARERAQAAGARNLTFTCVDAAIYRPDAPFDRMVSRFGSMFFPQPVEAFANLHACLTAAGRIDLAVWGPPRDNPWMMEMMGVLQRHLEVPPAVPRAPGPFAFEDTDYLGQVLTDAGFGDVGIAAWQGLQPVGGAGASADEAADFALSSLAAGRLLEGRDEALRRRVRDDLRGLYEHHHVAGEGVMMAGKAWLVTASVGPSPE